MNENKETNLGLMARLLIEEKGREQFCADTN